MSSCFFIGHRDALECLLPLVQETAERLIRQEGVTDFYVGSRGAFDHMAAKAVRRLMEIYPHVRLYRVLAYLPAQELEETSLGFTGTVFPEGLESVPRRFAIFRANRVMVDACDFLIAYAPRETGNARRVLDYARRRQGRGLLRVVELKENEQ